MELANGEFALVAPPASTGVLLEQLPGGALTGLAPHLRGETQFFLLYRELGRYERSDGPATLVADDSYFRWEWPLAAPDTNTYVTHSWSNDATVVANSFRVFDTDGEEWSTATDSSGAAIAWAATIKEDAGVGVGFQDRFDHATGTRQVTSGWLSSIREVDGTCFDCLITTQLFQGIPTTTATFEREGNGPLLRTQSPSSDQIDGGPVPDECLPNFLIQNTAMGADDDCPLPLGVKLPPPPAGDSWYIRSNEVLSIRNGASQSRLCEGERAQWDLSTCNALYTLGYQAETYHDHLSILAFGVPCNEESVSAFGSCSDPRLHDELFDAALHFQLGYMDNDLHAHSQLTIVVGTNNSWISSLDSVQGNAGAAAILDGHARDLFAEVTDLKYITEGIAFGDQITFVVEGGNDIETEWDEDANSVWRGPEETLPWVRAWNEEWYEWADECGEPERCVIGAAMINFGAYFRDCDNSGCWDDRRTGTQYSHERWSPHQIYDVSWGGRNPDYVVDEVIPQQYVEGWGTYWRQLNDAARATLNPAIAFLGVLWGCNAATGPNAQPNAGEAYSDFASETGQRPPYLTEIHALDLSC